MSLAALFGLGAAVLWGTADFLAKGMTEREGSEAALLWLYIVGFPIFLALALTAEGPLPGPQAAGLWIAAGALNACAYLLLYRGFRIGLLSVVSTTNAAWAAITVILTALFLAEWPPLRGWTGLVLTLTGVILVSYAGGGWSVRAPGFLEGLGAAVFFGSSFFLLRLPSAEGETYVQAAVMRGVGLLLVGGTVLMKGGFTRRFLRLPPLFSILDSAGFLCFVTGLASGAAYIVAPLGSLLTPVVVALAAIFLKERLTPHQWAGFAFVSAGALMLAR